MEKKTINRIRQISLSLTNEAEDAVTPTSTDMRARSLELDTMRQSLLASCPVWPYDLYRRACPYPVLVPHPRLCELRDLHTALSAAITSIVERWWTDKDARFPDRMPLEKQEEEILQWIDSPGRNMIPPFHKCQGSWRPDFLLEEVESVEQFRICEINARFAFNGFLHTAFGQQAFIDMGAEAKNLEPPAPPEKILKRLRSLFNPSLPLHLLKGEEAGLDIHLFISYLRSLSGQAPTVIAPSDLRLVPSPLSASGFMLYCVVREQRTGTEVLERIHQLGLELHQHELRSLSPSLLREIAKCCFNDLRTIFLVHDKRMLGLVLEELDALTNVQQVLTSSQAEILRCGITPTIIPGSREMLALIRTAYDNQGAKDDLLLKPIGGGKGAGIVFGSDMTPQAWASHLALLRRPDVLPGNVAYVVQREIKQPRYPILLHEAEGLQHNPLVGTYMSIHGQYLGLGLWRTSPNRICALSRGGAWICSVTSIKRPGIENADQTEGAGGAVRARVGGRAGTGIGAGTGTGARAEVGVGVRVGVDVKDREKIRLGRHSHAKVWLFVVILIAGRVYYYLVTLR